MQGKIHSIESFGTLDGPGVRLVVFFSGCPLRCQYCHNPDTWIQSDKMQMTANDIIDLYLKNKPFYENGGITASGGEPLMQIDFLIELFKAAKEKNIHTCLDTSGIIFDEDKLNQLISYCDLVMLDIKHIDPDLHKKLCGKSNETVLKFAHFLSEKKVPTWIRHVVVPGLTDQKEYLEKLGEFIGTLTNIKALDVLPYHDMAKTKYENLGIDYVLKDLKPLTKEKAVEAKQYILNGIKKKRL